MLAPRLVAAALSCCAFFTSIAEAAEGWTYKVIPTLNTPDNFPLAINDNGEIAYATRETLAGGMERASLRLARENDTVVLWESTYAVANGGGLFVQFIGVNNSGEVTFYGAPPGQATGQPRRLWRVAGGSIVPVNVGPYINIQSVADINNAGETVFVGANTSNGTGFSQVDMVAVNAAGTLRPASVFIPFSPSSANYRVPVINNNGDMATATFENLAISRARFRLARNSPSSITDVELEVNNGANVLSGIGLNDLGFGSAVTTIASGAQRLLMVIPAGVSGLPDGVIELARSGVNGVIQIQGETAISNFNGVSYSGLANVPGVGQAGFIAVKHPGSLPRVIVAQTGDAISPGGPVLTLIANSASAYTNKQGANDSGQLVFRASINGVGTIVRATPELGKLPERPVLPRQEEFLDEGWRLAVCRGQSVSRATCFYDPPVASGYTYTAEQPDLRFATVIVPAPLPGGDGEFAVEFNGTSQPLVAGQLFDFETFVPGGVSSFRITGISLGEGIDPADAAGFVTGIGIAGSPPANATFTMIPIIENTDDDDGDGVIESQDNCPDVANADQADEDGDGVGDACEPPPPTGTAPTVTPNIIGTLGANGWYTTNVSVNWTVVENGLPTTTLGCEAQSINVDTVGQAFTCAATNSAGTASQTVTIRRDTSAPAINIVSPALGASYAIGAAATANYSCSDLTAGIEQCSGSIANGAALDTSSAGSKSITVLATDAAGNTASVLVSYNVTSASDTSPPVIQPAISGTLGSNGWYTSNVTLTWQVNDPQSQVSASNGCQQRSVTQDTQGTTFTCQATSAGGSASRSVTIKRDSAAPTVVVLSPLGLTYPRGLWVPALFACVDLRSDVAQCRGTVSLGSRIDTASAGEKTFKVTATDEAGNTRVANVNYRVR